MRYVIYGAGAVGGGIGARLTQHGHDTVLIARGAHLEAMQRDGLRLRTPHEDMVIPVQAVAHPSEVQWTGNEVVLLCVKTQDTVPALEALRAAAGSSVRVVCAQNGVENEREAARRFEHVYGMFAPFLALYLTPGEVVLPGENVSGVLDAGCYPAATDSFVGEICADLAASGYSALPTERIMRLKYRKLIFNLGNVVQVLLRPGTNGRELIRVLREEAEAVYEAADVDCASEEEFTARSIVKHGKVPGMERSGGSTWQSVERGLPSLETDYLNGEIVLLGKQHGVPTPANRLVCDLSDRLLHQGLKPGAFVLDDILAQLGAG